MKVEEILMVIIGILSLIIFYKIYKGSLIEGVESGGNLSKLTKDAYYLYMITSGWRDGTNYSTTDKQFDTNVKYYFSLSTSLDISWAKLNNNTTEFLPQIKLISLGNKQLMEIKYGGQSYYLKWYNKGGVNYAIWDTWWGGANNDGVGDGRGGGGNLINIQIKDEKYIYTIHNNETYYLYPTSNIGDGSDLNISTGHYRPNFFVAWGTEKEFKMNNYLADKLELKSTNEPETPKNRIWDCGTCPWPDGVCPDQCNQSQGGVCHFLGGIIGVKKRCDCPYHVPLNTCL